MEGVYCAGDEKGLHRCFQTHSQPCSHIEDAAVHCSGSHDYNTASNHTFLPFTPIQCDYFPGPSAGSKGIRKLNDRISLGYLTVNCAEPLHDCILFSIDLVNVTTELLNKAVVTVVIQTNQVLANWRNCCGPNFYFQYCLFSSKVTWTRCSQH